MAGRPRSNTERGRASRYRAALKAGRTLTREQRAWLRSYTAAVARPAPKTSAERSRAARLRKRLAEGDGLDRRDSRWLDAYERSTGSKPQRRMRPALDDGERIARALAKWAGLPDATRTIDHERYAIVETTSRRKRAPLRRDPDAGLELDGRSVFGDPPKLPAPDGRAVGVRAQIGTPDGKRWVSLNAMTTDWDDLEIEIADSIDDIESAYQANGVYAWSVIVR